jgi:hypothetical protein
VRLRFEEGGGGLDGVCCQQQKGGGAEGKVTVHPNSVVVCVSFEMRSVDT